MLHGALLCNVRRTVQLGRIDLCGIHPMFSTKLSGAGMPPFATATRRMTAQKRVGWAAEPFCMRSRCSRAAARPFLLQPLCGAYLSGSRTKLAYSVNSGGRSLHIASWTLLPMRNGRSMPFPAAAVARRRATSSSNTATSNGSSDSSVVVQALPVGTSSASLIHHPIPRPSSFLQWYEGHLQARPVVTKMVSGSILWGLGDAVAQLMPYVVAAAATTVAAAAPTSTADPIQPDKPDSTDCTSKNLVALEYDWMRTGRAVFFGFVIHAPLSHGHYNFLEWLTVRAGLKGWHIPVFKAFMEQFVYWSWFSNALYHAAMGAMQGWSTTQIYNRIVDVLWDTQKAQWVFWIPIQLVNFSVTPVRHQLNVVLITSVVWTALLSAWYPPETTTCQSDRRLENDDLAD
jgi:protein Mpv17